MKKIILNKDWHIYKRDDAFSLTTSIPEDAVIADLPYDALFHDEQRADSPSGGRTGYFDGGVYYFQKELQLDKEMIQKQLYLNIEGAFSKSFVYVNSSLLKTGDFGYAGIKADITDYVNEGSNTILIICKTDPFSSRWYSGTGLLRPVYLLVGEDVYIKPDSTFLSCEEISEEGIVIRLVSDLINRSSHASLQNMNIKIADKTGTVFEDSIPLRIKDTYHLDRKLFFKNAHLYDENDPYLYDISLFIGNDEESFRTGFRKETFDPVHGLMINGKTVKLRGACIHHDEGILGGISSPAFERFRIAKLKEAGFNAIRSAHNHASQEVLQACDELGVYVLDEICDMWTKMKGFGDYAQYFSHSWKDVTHTTICEDRNHPCVMGYSTGNEISDINTEKGFEVAHALFEEIHLLDDTRFVTNGINGAFAAGEEVIDIAVDLTGKERSYYESGDVNRFMALMATRMSDIVTHPVVSKVLERMDSCVDVQGYNYMTARYEKDISKYPNRIMLGTETYPKQIAENWRLITALNPCIGEFTWTGWDYMGELSAPFPALNNTSGDLDRFGFRRPVSYYREIVYGLRQKPYLCVRPPKAFGTPREFGPWKFTDALETWTMDVPEGTMVTVEVYTAEPSVELFINNQSKGVKETKDCFALFDVPYEKGTLKAVTPQNLQVTLSTAENNVNIITHDESYDDILISQIELRDQHNTLVYGSGQSFDTKREGYVLIAAASEETIHDHGFSNEVIHLMGRGGLAIYKKN